MNVDCLDDNSVCYVVGDRGITIVPMNIPTKLHSHIKSLDEDNKIIGNFVSVGNTIDIVLLPYDFEYKMKINTMYYYENYQY